MGVVDRALSSAFSEYLDRISLNPTRERKIRGYAESVQKYMVRDAGGLGKYVEVEPFIHGSYSYGTTVRPKAGAADYDLDMILPLSRPFFERYGPAEAMGYIRGRLALNYGTVSQGNKCVRISNDDGFHVDIVPAYVPNGNASTVQIIDRRQETYIPSHPVAVTDWVAELNRNTCNRFSATARIFKRWRDAKFGSGTRPKSLLLTVLAGRSIEKAMREDADWRDLYRLPSTTMAEFVEATGIAMSDYLGAQGPRILVPGTNDDVGGKWTQGQQEAFMKRLDYFIEVASKANAAPTRNSALKRWSKLLGDDFPTTV